MPFCPKSHHKTNLFTLTSITLLRELDSNQRPPDYETGKLPSALSRDIKTKPQLFSQTIVEKDLFENNIITLINSQVLKFYFIG